MLKKLRNNKKKGFTLVELIVVLVILAILAALLIPALTGYIDKAKNKSVVADTRSAVMAAQTLVDEAYAKKDVAGQVEIGDGKDVTIKEIEDLAELSNGTVKEVVLTTDGKNQVQTLKYTKSGKTCTYTKGATNGTDGAYNVAK